MTIQEMMNLDGKVAIVTGGSRGLGEEMAYGLAELGANVVICSRKIANCEKVAEEMRLKGLKVEAHACDTRKEDNIMDLVKYVGEKYGSVDIIVNNAGATWGAPITEMTLDAWNKVQETNVAGTFLMCREAIPYMKKKGWGRIINISSAAALGGSKWKGIDCVGYAASKGAIISFTRDVAVKMRNEGITANTVVPGHFSTSMSKNTLQVIEQIGKPDALGPIAPAEDIKGLVGFLATDAAKFISGAVITCDGTLTAQMADNGISIMNI